MTPPNTEKQEINRLNRECEAHIARIEYLTRIAESKEEGILLDSFPESLDGPEIRLDAVHGCDGCCVSDSRGGGE